MRLVWFPTGRKLWFDLARDLQETGEAEVVLWLGDDRHLKVARARFPDARVLSLEDLRRNRWTIPATDPARCDDAGPWSGEAWHRLCDTALKLMDRDDRAGRHSPLEREAFLHQLVFWAVAEIESLRPDAVVMAEAAHSAPQHVFQAVAAEMGVKVLRFVSWPLLPGLELRSGEAGPRIRISRTALSRQAFLARAEAEIDAYLKGFDGGDYAFEPRYMRIQQGKERLGSGWLKSPAARRIEAALRMLLPRQRRHARERKALEAAVAHIARPDLPETGRYVYFPLHYEPERTTTPDGGAYRDQLRAIALLRSVLPAEVAIVVKEHPSIFNFQMHGHQGRHPRAYSALTHISGVHLVPTSLPSNRILSGCEAIATITGTVALEAATVGKPALFFGNPWYDGCPNTHRFRPGLDWDEFLNREISDRRDVRDWLVGTVADYVTPGTVNPSNERYFSAWYDDSEYRTEEAAGMADLLREGLRI